MRLFVSEYVCSGAWPDGHMPVSLAREGGAMLSAFAEDCSRIPGCDVVTTWDAPRFGAWEHSRVHVVEVSSPDEEWQHFVRLSAECDATYVIAPELDNLLASRCRAVLNAGGRLMNAIPEAIELCSDKLRLAAELERIGVATIPTCVFDPASPAPGYEPAVVKPRFGAGSQSIFGIGFADGWAPLRSVFATEPETRQGIIQPWIRGTAMSMAALFGPDGQCRSVLPAAEQQLSQDERFRYLGGRLPCRVPCEAEMADAIRHTAAAIGGFRGYIGFDFVVVGDGLESPLLVEINPRLTTSYLGYRKLARNNLAEPIVSPAQGAVEVSWRPGVVAFSCDGRLIDSDWQAGR